MTAVHEFGGTPTFEDVQLGPGGYPEEKAAFDVAAVPPAPGRVDVTRSPAGAHAGDDMTALFDELQRDVHLDDIVLPVPHRPGWGVRYRRLLDAREMQPWRREAYDPDSLEGIDQIKLGSRGLAELSVGVVRDGRDAKDEHGAPFTFRSPQFQQLLKADSAVDAVRRWYTLDAHVTATWLTILDASGFSDVIAPVNEVGPTSAPERPDPS